MATPLHVLIVDDQWSTAELLLHELRRAGFDPTWCRAANEEEYLEHLKTPLDLILAAYTLPMFDAVRALQLLRTHGLDVPLIVVTGSMSEAAAIECIKLGAADYLLKDRLARIGSAVRQALTQRDLHAYKRMAEAALQESEERFRAIFQNTMLGIAIVDLQGCLMIANPAFEELLGYTSAELQHRSLAECTYPDDVPSSVAHFNELVAGAHSHYQIEKRYVRKNGQLLWARLSVSLGRRADHTAQFVIVTVEDITTRKQADEVRARLAAIVDGSDDAIISVAPDGTILSWNASAERIYGYAPAEVIGQSVALLSRAAQQSETKQLLERLGSGERIVHYETTRTHKDGQSIDVALTISPIKDERGSITGFSTIARDITERKRTETALAEERNLLRTLIDTLPDEIYIKNAQSQFLNANTTVACIHGFSTPDQLIGKTDFDLQPYEEALADYRAEQAILQSGQPMINRETSNRDKTSWRLETKIPFRDSQGQIVGLMGVNRFITERKRAEEALRQAEQRYRDLFEDAPVMYVITHNRGGMPIIADCNVAFCNTIGYPRAELLGRPLVDFYTPDSRDRLVGGSYEQALAGTFSDQERALVTRDGRVIQTILRAVPEPSHDGEIAGIRAMYVDISERKGAEFALAEERALLARRVDERTADLSTANAELARAAKLKDEFLASMSHELRTPLNAVLGLSEALREEIYGPLTLQQRRSLQSIEESGRHLLELINDILDLAKVGAGKLELEPNPVAIVAICQASLRLIKQEAHKKQLAIESAIDPAVTLLHIDARRLKQILVNLLSNAVKFTAVGGAIGLDVTGDPERQVVHLTVWDTGIGIAPEDMERLFQPFVQIDSRLSRQYNGTGLGLALVYRMVELHGGSITVTSQQGCGSRFRVSLPWRPAIDTVQPRSRASETTSSVAIGHALIIEDSPTTAAQLARYLDEMGVTTVTSSQGADAVALALSTHPDLIVLDMLLPDTSGYQVLQDLKADSRTAAIPVLIVSVVDDRADTLTAGAAEYLVKPVTRQDVQQVLHRLGRMGMDGMDACSARRQAMPYTRPTVLLAEDNETNIAAMSDYLCAKGYQVVVARNGAEALSHAREIVPAIILMDIQMPGMDGLEAIQRIGAEDSLAHIPIIAVTALAMPGDRERCLAAGANDYLSKPVSLKELTTAIETQLQHATIVPDTNRH